EVEGLGTAESSLKRGGGARAQDLIIGLIGSVALDGGPLVGRPELLDDDLVLGADVGQLPLLSGDGLDPLRGLCFLGHLAVLLRVGDGQVLGWRRRPILTTVLHDTHLTSSWRRAWRRRPARCRCRSPACWRPPRPPAARPRRGSWGGARPYLAPGGSRRST